MSNTPKITGTRYVLAVKDLVKSAEYYKLLGFGTIREDGYWHFLARDKFIVMLGECPDERSASEIGDHSYFAYIDVGNIDDLYQEYQSKGIQVLSDISNQDWGQREFSVKTIDGHRIRFGADQRINYSPTYLPIKRISLV